MSAVFRYRTEGTTQTVSSNEAKQHWGAIIRAASNGEDVVVESHGKPRAAVISIERLEKLHELETKERREVAVRKLREIEARYDGRNDDLTEEQVEEIAVREGREINRAVAERLRARSRQST